MKTVLLPTDFSKNSLNAIYYAFDLFSGLNIRFILFNAYSIPPISIQEYITEIPDFAGDSEKKLLKIKNSVSRKFPKEKNIEFISRLGKPIGIIERIVRNSGVDLTVMGTKGAGGIRGIFIGSTTKAAINKLSCPILAVPEKAIFRKPRNIAFASDLKNLPVKSKINPLLFLAKRFSAEILILHVAKNIRKLGHSGIEERQELKKIFAAFSFSFHLVQEENAIDGIENFIRSGDVDLLSLISGKHTILENIFNQSITQKLSLRTKIPLLVFHE